jgi:hypothetical protein
MTEREEEYERQESPEGYSEGHGLGYGNYADASSTPPDVSDQQFDWQETEQDPRRQSEQTEPDPEAKPNFLPRRKPED